MKLVLRHLRRVAFLHDQDRLTDGQLLEQFLAQRAEPAFEALGAPTNHRVTESTEKSRRQVSIRASKVHR